MGRSKQLFDTQLVLHRIFHHCSYFATSLVLLFAVKALNPPALDYHFDFSTQIECIDANLSGISFNPESENFFVISNSPEVIVEISPRGKCLNQFPLTGYQDTEDLFYLENDKILLVQERQQTVDLLRIEDQGITHLQTLALGLGSKPNKGLEGVSYNSKSSSMFIVNEFPQKLLKVSDWQPMSGFKNVEPVTTFWSKVLLGDYSAVTDSGKGLILLSDRSSKLLELDYNGSVKASLVLHSDPSRSSVVQQAEGVAMDANHNLYIVSEPNLLYVYKKNPARQAGF